MSDKSSSTNSSPTKPYNENEHYLPISRRQIQEIFCRKFQTPQDANIFEKFCVVLDQYFYIRYFKAKNKLLHEYDFFSRKKQNTTELSSRDRVQKEDSFLKDLVKILKEANFKLLSKQEWDFAVQNSFLFSLPMEINWKKLDNHIISRLLDANPEMKKVSSSDRILIFRRGIGVITKKGRFVWEKLDLISELLILEPFTKYIYSPLSVQFPSVLSYWKPRSFGEIPSPPVVYLDTTTGKPISRITLRDHMSSAINVAKNLFSEVSVQEPTFKDVVVIYRPKPSEINVENLSEKKSTEKKPSERSSLMHGDNTENTIDLKVFGEVPIGDIEAIFPDAQSSIQVRTIDQIQLSVTIIIVLLMLLLRIFSYAESFSLMMLITLCLRFVQLWLGLQDTRSLCIGELTGLLYSQTMAAGNSVISWAVNSAEDQEILEVLLGFYFISQSSDPISEEVLDDTIQEFLFKQSGLHCDFEVKDALDKLVKLQLATYNEKTGKYTAKKFSEAVEILEKNVGGNLGQF